MTVSVSPPGKYPGVYVKTVIDAQPPTGGASTSVAAFIGRTPQGPVNTPVTCLNFADFQRQFGGLSPSSSVSYQASAFFQNGGNQAEIVRLYRLPAAPITVSGVTAGTVGTYTLTLEPLLSGPTIQVSTGNQFTSTSTAPKTPDDVYNALAMELETEPALAGLVTGVTVTAASLVFNLSYPCTLVAGGPGLAVSPDTTGSGSAILPFNTGISFQVAPAAKSTQPVVLSVSPPGGASFSISVPAPPNGWPGTSGDPTAALALYKAIRQSSRASALVTTPNPPTSGVLALQYAGAAALSLTVDGANVPGTDAPDPTGFQLVAANPGEWGNAIIAAVDTTGINSDVARKYGLKAGDLFNLSVYCGNASERFTAVTLVASAGANRLDRVLANGSALVRLLSSIGTVDPQTGAPAVPASGAWGQAADGVDSDPLQLTDYIGDPGLKTGLYAFNQNPYGFNILSIPPDVDTTDIDPSVYQEAAQICADNNAMLIIDPPLKWNDNFKNGDISYISLSDLGSFTDAQARACAVYFPRVIIADPLRNGLPRVVAPSGYLAAAWASVDAAVGVWKAPAGLDAPIGGILELQFKMNDAQNGVLNPKGINALRFFTGAGSVVWGARTLRGDDQLADQYKYIPVQRLLDYIETSLLNNTLWAVFQPNGEALWAKLQTQVTVFMNSLFSQGAFAGTSASQAYFVKCDASTTTPSDAAAGIVNVQVGFAPIYPAEFVVITISQQTASSG
jgi:hypothetical protein